MNNPDIIAYIRNEIARHESDEAIKARLLGVGWEKADVESAFASVKGTPVVPVVPAAPVAPTAPAAPIVPAKVAPSSAYPSSRAPLNQPVSPIRSAPIFMDFSKPGSAPSVAPAMKPMASPIAQAAAAAPALSPSADPLSKPAWKDPMPLAQPAAPQAAPSVQPYGSMQPRGAVSPSLAPMSAPAHPSSPSGAGQAAPIMAGASFARPVSVSAPAIGFTSMPQGRPRGGAFIKVAIALGALIVIALGVLAYLFSAGYLSAPVQQFPGAGEGDTQQQAPASVPPVPTDAAASSTLSASEASLAPAPPAASSTLGMPVSTTTAPAKSAPTSIPATAAASKPAAAPAAPASPATAASSGGLSSDDRSQIIDAIITQNNLYSYGAASNIRNYLKVGASPADSRSFAAMSDSEILAYAHNIVAGTASTTAAYLGSAAVAWRLGGATAYLTIPVAGASPATRASTEVNGVWY